MDTQQLWGNSFNEWRALYMEALELVKAYQDDRSGVHFVEIESRTPD